MYRPYTYTTEDEIEPILCQGSCFQEFLFIDYKRDLASGLEHFPVRVHPDLIYVSKDFKHWGIVEIELSKHDIKGHIWPQLMMLKTIIDSLTFEHRYEILKECGISDNIARMLAYNRPFLFLIFDKSIVHLRDLIFYASSIASILFINAFSNDFNNFMYLEESYFEGPLQNKFSLAITKNQRLNILSPSLVGLNYLKNGVFRIDLLNGDSITSLKLNIINGVVYVEGLKQGYYRILNSNNQLKIIKHEI
jgi:hypothetical protein